MKGGSVGLADSRRAPLRSEPLVVLAPGSVDGLTLAGDVDFTFKLKGVGGAILLLSDSVLTTRGSSGSCNLARDKTHTLELKPVSP